MKDYCCRYAKIFIISVYDVFFASVYIQQHAMQGLLSWPFLNGLFSRGSIFGISTIRTHFYYFFLLLLRLFVYNRIVNTSFLVSSSWTKGVKYSFLQNYRIWCFTEMKDLEIGTVWNGKERTNLYVAILILQSGLAHVVLVKLKLAINPFYYGKTANLL